MKKIFLRLLLGLFLFTCSALKAQDKKLWAKSFLHQKAPELVVESWLTEIPNTEGKFLLIDFWATWCGPCKKGIPELNAFHEKFKDKLVVMGISDEPEEKVKKLHDPEITYYSAIDTQGRTKALYGVQAIPHCVIIDPNGMVVWEGWPQLEGFELTEQVISQLLQNHP